MPRRGKQTDITLFAEVKKYIEDFEAMVASGRTGTEAMSMMKSLYPAH